MHNLREAVHNSKKNLKLKNIYIYIAMVGWYLLTIKLF